MAVTMRDIAKLAEVDPSVVSAALNGSRTIRVSAAKCERIRELARKMNYRPNLVARSLVTRKTRLIGVAFCNPSDRFYAELTAQVQRRLTERGYVGIYGFFNDDDERHAAYEMMLERGVDGMITCGDEDGTLPLELPTVVYNSTAPHRVVVQLDYHDAITEILKYLTALGHRKIGFASFKMEDWRCRSFVELAPQFGVTVKPHWLLRSDGFGRSSFAAVRRLLEGSDVPTAIIGRNDVSALGALNAAAMGGFAVPERLSVIGMDGIQEGEYSYPPLDTFIFPLAELAGELLHMLFERMEHPDAPPYRKLLKTGLVKRASCGLVAGDLK